MFIPFSSFKGIHAESNKTLATFTVTNTNDAGAGSLRDAANQANANGVPDLIEFNIAGGGSPQTISLASPIFIAAGTIVDGSTQGALITLAPQVMHSHSGMGMEFTSNCEIIGLHFDKFINGIEANQCIDCSVRNCFFTDFSDTGIRFVNASSGGVIENNQVGTNLAGDADATPIGGTGILLINTSNMTIQNNLTSGFDDYGIALGLFSQNNIIQNNIIGLNAAQTATIPNRIGIRLNNSDNNQVLNNVIGGCTQAGIQIDAILGPG